MKVWETIVLAGLENQYMSTSRSGYLMIKTQYTWRRSGREGKQMLILHRSIPIVQDNLESSCTTGIDSTAKSKEDVNFFPILLADCSGSFEYKNVKGLRHGLSVRSICVRCMSTMKNTWERTWMRTRNMVDISQARARIKDLITSSVYSGSNFMIEKLRNTSWVSEEALRRMSLSKCSYFMEGLQFV